MCKFAIYVAFGNDRSLARRFAGNFAGADLVVAADYGSRDGTAELLGAMGAQIVNAQGHDRATARNHALALIPADYICVALEMTDLLSAGWRDAVESIWKPHFMALAHRAIWRQGCAEATWRDIVVARFHAREAPPVCDNDLEAINQHPLTQDIVVDHEPAPRQLDGGGLVAEYGGDTLQDACALFLSNRFLAARDACKAWLATTPHPEVPWFRREAWRLLAAALRAISDRAGSAKVLDEALNEFPADQCILIDRTYLAYEDADWETCLRTALTVTNSPLESSPTGKSWFICSQLTPFDLGAIAASHLGQADEALRLGTEALVRDWTSDRLRANVRAFRASNALTIPRPEADARPRLILISGAWSSGTSAVAGMTSRLGANGIPPYLLTNDPRTPNSYESQCFSAAVSKCIPISGNVIGRATADVVMEVLGLFREDLQWLATQRGDPQCAVPFWAKVPTSAFLIEELATLFDLDVVLVKRPLAAIEATRVRRDWPELFGSLGATQINNALESKSVAPHVKLSLDYEDILANPMKTARALADLVGNVSTQSVADACDFITKRAI